MRARVRFDQPLVVGLTNGSVWSFAEVRDSSIDHGKELAFSSLFHSDGTPSIENLASSVMGFSLGLTLLALDRHGVVLSGEGAGKQRAVDTMSEADENVPEQVRDEQITLLVSSSYWLGLQGGRGESNRGHHTVAVKHPLPPLRFAYAHPDQSGTCVEEGKDAQLPLEDIRHRP